MSAMAYSFVVDLLFETEPRVRAMFGAHAIYIGERLVLVTRKKTEHPEANGVWVATTKEHHESLKKEFPSLSSIIILSNGKSETNWQMISENEDDFEESVSRICELIRKGDQRIGTLPKKKKPGK
jgi:16S rRNA C1402 (ribose-2'-O) methylase RsmI